MSINAILPEVYTFLDFTRHALRTARKKGQNSYSAHLAGEVPEITLYSMPYNVYVPIREYLYDNKGATEELIEWLENELMKPDYALKKVTIKESKVSVKRSFGRVRSYPQIDVTMEW